MLRNYFTLAFRSLVRQGNYTLLNSLGLGVSVACCLTIYLLAGQQLSFNKFEGLEDRLGRVVTELHLENIRYSNGVPYPMAAALQQEFSFIQKAATLDGYHEVIVEVPAADGGPVAKFKEEDAVAYAGPELFDLLPFPLVRGDLSAFTAPNTAILTEKAARRYFGDAEPLGRSFKAFDGVDFRVVGILRDPPPNTDCSRQVYCSWATLANGPDRESIASWGTIRGNTQCFVLLEKGHTMSELAAQLPAFSARYPHPVRKDVFAYQAFTLPALHFDTRYDNTFDARYLWAFGCVGLFLLVTACLNFINMATARSLTRAREVGVRKSLGGTRGQLFGQFMFETSLIVVLALLTGLLLCRMALPFLNAWLGQQLHFEALATPRSAVFTGSLGLALCALAGVYPGLVLSRFQPALSLKGQVKTGGFSLRKGLVATQFVISQLLIIGAVVVTLQMRYALQSDWGFQHKAIVTIPLPDTEKAPVLGQQLAALGGVDNWSFCSAPPASDNSNQTFFKYEDRGEPEAWTVHFLWGDDRYLATFGLQLLAGENFAPGDSSDQCLVNETFVRKLQLGNPADIVGTHIRIESKNILIRGVVRDFHAGSFREDIPPMLVQKDPKSYSICALQLSAADPRPVLRAVSEPWNALFPADFFEYRFMDEQMAGFYEQEIRLLRLIDLFAGIAILIGALGLFGLTAFMVARKTREIGIRKILGATVPGLLWLFGKEYTRLLLVAFVVAAPLGWWAMRYWLADFAYRIEVGWAVFGLALAISVLSVVLTVGYQSIRAALANPARNLRSE